MKDLHHGHTTEQLLRLKELYLYGDNRFYEGFIEKLKNVIERLTTWSCDYEDLTDIIGYFPKLKHFRIQNINDTNKINLNATNEERKKLAGVCKTTIYVHENVFCIQNGLQ